MPAPRTTVCVRPAAGSGVLIARRAMLPLPPAGGTAMSGQETAPHTFTVFTPTFNRRATLEAAYRSLAAQTFRDFEWLVVDDGSTDDTQDFVASLSVEADFRVVYHYQANS